jgi:hypothetical protein
MKTKRMLEKLVSALQKTCSVPLTKTRRLNISLEAVDVFPENRNQSALCKVNTGVSQKQPHLKEHKEVSYSQHCQISSPQDTYQISGMVANFWN